MRDEFRIEGHKLLYHPREVSRWQAGEDVYPIYMEISPSGGCNHRCSFCAFDYRGYRPRFLPAKILKERISELAGLGVKSIMYAGEGEPLLHQDIADIAAATREAGIDVAVTTNGVFLSPPLAEKLLPVTTWIRVSVNAGSASTYSQIHGAAGGDFGRVMQNLRGAEAIRRRLGLSCTIGVQAVLLPENAAEIEDLARRAKEAGLDYFVVKPYSRHHKSINSRYDGMDYSRYADLAEALACLEDEAFSIVFRTQTMEKIRREERGYGRCLALPFWAYLDAGGNVWGCSSFLGDDGFLCGNITGSTFREIWTGDRRKRLLDYAATCLDPSGCRLNCRMNEVNRYLWGIARVPEHVNFI